MTSSVSVNSSASQVGTSSIVSSASHISQKSVCYNLKILEL